MAYTDSLYTLYKTAGMQRQLSYEQMQEMDLAYSNLRQVVSELDKVGIRSYKDLDKLKTNEVINE